MSILSSIQHASLPHLSWVTPPKQFAQFHACTSSALHYAQKNKLDALVVANEWLLMVKTIPGVVDATVTSPGYINIMVDPIEAVAYLKNKAKPLPKKYLLEFVSANPTGPLHLGHARQAVIGNVLHSLPWSISATKCTANIISTMLVIKSSIYGHPLRAVGNHLWTKYITKVPIFNIWLSK